MKKLFSLLLMIYAYTLACEVFAGNLKFESVQKIEIRSSLKEITDRATITLPRNQLFKDKLITEYLREGQTVVVKLGYNGKTEEEFRGYIQKISHGVPLIVECEDEMYQLKSALKNKSWNEVKLSELLKYIAPDYECKIVDDISLGKFEIVNSTGAQVLEKLKEFELYASFSGNILHVGLFSGIGDKTKHLYDKYHIKNGKNLGVVKAEDQKYKIRALSSNRNGKKLKKEYGDDGGDLRTFHFIDKTEAELLALAKDKLNELKRTRCVGDITGFGIPRTHPGDWLTIDNPYNRDTDGTYQIESVTVHFGSEGYERINQVGIRLS